MMHLIVIITMYVLSADWQKLVQKLVETLDLIPTCEIRKETIENVSMNREVVK